MNKLKQFFNQIKWFEYVIMATLFAVVIVVGVLFGSTAMIITDSILGITYIFLNAKGFLVANIFGIVRNIFYTIICINNRYYGEVVVCAISLLAIIITLYTWYKNRDGNSLNLKIGKTVGWVEWIGLFVGMFVVSIGFYFMLQAFDTQNLIISTLSVTMNLGASYLLARRSEFSFVLFMANNIMGIVLWLMIVLKGDLSYIPTLINFAVFIALNVYGIINWLRLKKQQQSISNNEKQKETVKE